MGGVLALLILVCATPEIAQTIQSDSGTRSRTLVSQEINDRLVAQILERIAGWEGESAEQAQIALKEPVQVKDTVEKAISNQNVEG